MNTDCNYPAENPVDICDCAILSSGDVVKYRTLNASFVIVTYDIVIEKLLEGCYNIVTSAATLGFKPGKHRCYSARIIDGPELFVFCSGIDVLI